MVARYRFTFGSVRCRVDAGRGVRVTDLDFLYWQTVIFKLLKLLRKSGFASMPVVL